jgi:hypothetical protein
MANITDQDIIDHLKEKINFHQQEIKRLQAALNAFVPPANVSAGKSKPAAPAKAAKPAPQAADDVQTPEAAPPQMPATIQIPAKYTDNLSLEEKVVFALNEIKSGFSEDIAGTMAQYEPKSDAKTIGRQITGLLASLKSEGKIQSEKAGRKEKYSLTAS